jgi:creatinine amidohydrolase/Fe(II)-dependent formamide hydrolase-like protein
MPAIELCGEMLEEHEAAIVQAHAGTDSFASWQHARQVRVQVTKACTEQRFNQAKVACSATI